MTDCDAWMGKRMWRVFQGSGLFDGTIQAHTLAESSFVTGMYDRNMVNDFRSLVRQGMVSEVEYARYRGDVELLAARG